MATDIRTHPNGTASDVDFRGFVQAIQAAITAIGGMVVTTDTGQINSATVVNPAANVVAGYEIYKMTDSLQATAPVLLKIEYGNGPINNDHGLYVTLGLGGSDGAGNLAAPKSVPLQAQPNNPTANAAYSLRTCGAANRLTMFGGLGAAYVDGTGVNAGPSSHFGFSVERSHNDDGTDSADGAFIVAHNAGYGAYSRMTWDSQYVTFTGTFGPNTGLTVNGPNVTSKLAMPWYDSGTMVVGVNVGVVPLYMPNAGVKNPSRCLAGYLTGDLNNDTTVSFTQYGAVRTYRSIGSWVNCMDNNGVFGGGNVPAASHGCMMRWE